MDKNQENTFKNLFGLLGRNISYSFSRGYFSEKFEKEGIQDSFYTNFDIPSIDKFPEIIQQNKNLKGMNVTIPYKEDVIPYLDELDETAKMIGAVNTIQFKNNKLIGHNTDYYGFLKSLEPFLKPQHSKALVLGTGGAAKAVLYVMKLLGINAKLVSRNPKLKQYSYTDLNKEIIQNNKLIINTTPLGTHPNITDKPSISYQHITSEHLLFDLIYNPAETAFLLEGKKRGATIANGASMLQLQAEKAWTIWNS
ncbi:shikimate dehydrogenase [Pustulibacterium marinum]|uniref:Shikimate dehydrogenase n=1 Tax=Pustulibacterium marinum TaxID=1224947 RepID=A0A1I7G5S0_9FLAO|nr:shikimate dehydrogenase [Pustulibacterium marinum]SFU43701.1 shikimate dehydrogenase [Pustulibacterium marinum]